MMRAILRHFNGAAFAALLAVVAFTILALHGLTFTLGGFQGFRQSQTAIATKYIVEEGPMLRTRIPVLGPDWKVAFEFPTYQHLVAAFHLVSGLPLDVSGRLVSLLCLLAALPALWIILREWGLSPPLRWLLIAAYVSSPLTIFISRTFLIESCALMLTLWFIAGSMRYLRAPNRSSLLLLLLTGLLAAVTKFTTFSIGFGFIVLWSGARYLLHNSDRPAPPLRHTAVLCGAVASMILTAVAWKSFLDFHWERFPATTHFAENIHSWNFGTIEQRFSGEFWGRFVEHGINNVTFTPLLWLITIPLFALATYRWRVLALCAFAAWLSGPIVWANLFYVHNYYYYANSWLGFIWIVTSLAGVIDRWQALRIPLQACAWVVVVAFFIQYPQSAFFKAQKNDWGMPKVAFAQQVGTQVGPDEVIFILGDDWSPLIPYYADCHAVMVRWQGYCKGKQFAAILEGLEAEGRVVAGLIVNTRRPMPTNEAFLRARFAFAEAPAADIPHPQFQFFPVIRQQP
jgi:hypothetical protein